MTNDIGSIRYISDRKELLFDMHLTNLLVTIVFWELEKIFPDGLVTFSNLVFHTQLLMVPSMVGHVHCAIWLPSLHVLTAMPDELAQRIIRGSLEVTSNTGSTSSNLTAGSDGCPHNPTTSISWACFPLTTSPKCLYPDSRFCLPHTPHKRGSEWRGIWSGKNQQN